MIKIKAAFVIAIMFFVAFLLLPGSAIAAEEFKLSASVAGGEAGSQVRVTITADMAGDTEGGQFNLIFDHNIVRPILIETGSLVTEAANPLYMANLDYAPDTLIFMWVTVNADTADNGELCTVTFELLKEGITELKFEEIVIVAVSERTVTTQSGKITVKVAGGDDIDVTPPAEPEPEDNGQAESGPDGEEVIADDNGQGDEESGLVVAVDSENGGMKLLLYIIPVLFLIIAALFFFNKKRLAKVKKAVQEK